MNGSNTLRAVLIGFGLYCLVICFCLLPIILKAQEYGTIGSYRKSTYTKDTTRLMQAIEEGMKLARQHPDSAQHLYKRLFRESKQLGFNDGMASALLDIGTIFYNTGYIDSAISTFQYALPYAVAATGRRTQLTTGLYCNIAAMYMVKSKYREAVQYYDSALQTAIRYGMAKDHIYFANIYINMSYLYGQLDNYPTSFRYVDQAIILSLRKGYREQLAKALFNKAVTYRTLGKLPEATAYYKKVEELAKKNGYSDLYQSTYKELAKLLEEQGDSVRAAAYYNQSIKSEKAQRSSVNNTWMQYWDMAVSYLKSNNYKEAEHYFLLAQKSIRKEGLQQKEISILYYLVAIYEQTGRYPQALEQQKEMMQLKDSLQQINNLKVINELDIKYRTAEKNKQIALQANAVRIKNIWITTSIIVISSLLIVLLILQRQYRQRKKIYHQQEEITQLRAMIKGEERERTRLARELHDGIGGMMAAISMGLSQLSEKKATGLPYQKLESLVSETAHEIRRTAHNLIPSVLERESLSEALRHYCAGLSIKEGLVIETHFNGPVNQLEQAPALFIYRIIQELLQNIVKHAAASLAEVQITVQENILSIMVEDNGKGFDQDAIQPGMGLCNLQYRVNALHGHLSINSVQGKSTTVYIELQLEKLKLIV